MTKIKTETEVDPMAKNLYTILGCFGWKQF